MVNMNYEISEKLHKKLCYKALELKKTRKDIMIMAIEDFVSCPNVQNEKNK